MTQEQKDKIIRYRGKGMGYGKIAQILSLSVNTIKSFCRRNTGQPCQNIIHESKDVCKQCGKPLIQNPRHREKKFCSAACRMKWWGIHAEEMHRHNRLTCHCCGKKFYGKPGRKFCSHSCYIKERFGDRHVS